MATVASGVLIAWPGSVATIPSGFARDTALDGRHARGAAAGINPFGSGGTPAGTQGGSATHTHPDAATPHTHSVGSHSHGATGNSGGTITGSASGNTGGAGGVNIPDATHRHPGGATQNNTDTLTGTPTWTAGASDPPTTYSVIWVTSNGTPTGFPVNAVLYWANQAGVPTGWTQLLQQVAGANVSFYLVGAATGLGGGTQAGTGIAGHTHTDAGHTHTLAGHGHSTATTAVELASTAVYATGAGGTFSGTAHTHVATATSSATASGSGSGGTTAATTAEPPYNTLIPIQNQSGGVSFPAYVIGLWRGTLAAIPAGWSLCDGTNGTPDMRTLFARAGVLLGEIGDTGGSQSHSHTAPTTTHTHDTSHTHSMTVAGDTAAGTGAPSGSTLETLSNVGHTHSAITSDSTGGQSGTGTLGVGNATDARPPYTDIAFICYTAAPTVSITSPAGGAVLTVPTALVQWSFDVLRIQVDYRLQVFAADGVTVVYDSGTVVSATQQAAIPVGYLQDSTTYKLQVTATDSGHQQAVSAQVSVSTSWTQPPTPGGLALSPVGGT